MSNYTEYSSKATAVRGAKRMGATEDMLDTVVMKGRDGKWLVSAEEVSELLAAAQRGDGTVVQGEDKGDAIGAVTTASAAEQMTQDEIDNDLAETCGHSHCPSCGTHLSNGLMDFDSLADQHGEAKAYTMQKHAWSCMGCNAEWGAEIAAPSGKSSRKEPTRHYVGKSTVEGAVSLSPSIFDANPDARRKDAIQLAVDAGITFYTARTQYQKWFKARKSNKGLAKA